eukprot:NODE_244_length_2398_cov_5.595147_g190_i0.p1 GENE.NODE_244_length_2398_cov_5.595147_g190_i0~~NODE_244_length_2398_cov_5.595147_g190_i0.p1  ORF type:complete len:585 (+),score=164.09 NODE_244_length_2398_cov_5.595147_g190_i0:575-2329(+)
MEGLSNFKRFLTRDAMVLQSTVGDTARRASGLRARHRELAAWTRNVKSLDAPGSKKTQHRSPLYRVLARAHDTCALTKIAQAPFKWRMDLVDLRHYVSHPAASGQLENLLKQQVEVCEEAEEVFIPTPATPKDKLTARFLSMKRRVGSLIKALQKHQIADQKEVDGTDASPFTGRAVAVLQEKLRKRQDLLKLLADEVSQDLPPTRDPMEAMAEIKRLGVLLNAFGPGKVLPGTPHEEFLAATIIEDNREGLLPVYQSRLASPRAPPAWNPEPFRTFQDADFDDRMDADSEEDAPAFAVDGPDGDLPSPLSPFTTVLTPPTPQMVSPPATDPAVRSLQDSADVQDFWGDTTGHLAIPAGSRVRSPEASSASDDSSSDGASGYRGPGRSSRSVSMDDDVFRQLREGINDGDSGSGSPRGSDDEDDSDAQQRRLESMRDARLFEKQQAEAAREAAKQQKINERLQALQKQKDLDDTRAASSSHDKADRPSKSGKKTDKSPKRLSRRSSAVKSSAVKEGKKKGKSGMDASTSRSTPSKPKAKDKLKEKKPSEAVKEKSKKSEEIPKEKKREAKKAAGKSKLKKSPAS